MNAKKLKRIVDGFKRSPTHGARLREASARALAQVGALDIKKPQPLEHTTPFARCPACGHPR